MRKLIMILLALVVLLALVACTPAQTPDGTTEPQEAAVFRVGFGRTDVLPEESVPLASYANDEQRWSQGYLTGMYSHCVAVTDANNNTLLLMNTDTSWGVFESEITTKINELTGVPLENIIHCGNHTHSGVSTGYAEYPSVARYNEKYITNVVQAAVLAMEDRAPAEVYIGSAETENLNFVRRYFREDGTIAADNYGILDQNGNVQTSPIVSHESQADPELQMIRFVREGKKDILMANYQCHPHLHGMTYDASAENWGAFREAVEKALDTYCVVFNGAAGNINSHSRLEDEMRTWDFREWGELLCDYVEETWDNMTKVTGGEVKSVRYTYVGKVNHTEDHKLAQAYEVRDYFMQKNDTVGAAVMGFPYGINSGIHAMAIINKAGRPETYDIIIGAYAIGDISFISVPYEMFDTNGMYIKDNSPFEMTFICDYWGSQNLAYIPSQMGYDNGGYAADNSLFMPGTGEELADAYLGLLNGLYN